MCKLTVSVCFFQVFDSNLGKEKLQRVKLGAGKAQSVSSSLTQQCFKVIIKEI